MISILWRSSRRFVGYARSRCQATAREKRKPLKRSGTLREEVFVGNYASFLMVMRCSNKLDCRYFCDFIFLYAWFEKRNLSWDLSHPINISKNIVLWIFTHIFVSTNFVCLNFTLSIINDLSPFIRILSSLIIRFSQHARAITSSKI